jgi:hypothetical protein
MFDDILAGLNWIAFVATFAAGGGAYSVAAGRKLPSWANIVSVFLAFIVVTTAWFFLYGAIGFPGWMRWPTELLVGRAPTQSFAKAGFFSVNLKGWQHSAAPSGDVFTCSICSGSVQVRIDYGEELTKEAIYKTNKELLAALSTETSQRKFVESMIRTSTISQSGLTVSIKRIGLSQIGGLEVLQYYAVLEMPSITSHDNSMLAIHKNRLMKLTLLYLDGAMNDKTRAATDELYKSLRFL